MNSPDSSPSLTKKTWSTPTIEALKAEETLAGSGANNEYTCTATNYTDDSGASNVPCPPV